MLFQRILDLLCNVWLEQTSNMKDENKGSQHLPFNWHSLWISIANILFPCLCWRTLQYGWKWDTSRSVQLHDAGHKEFKFPCEIPFITPSPLTATPLEDSGSSPSRAGFWSLTMKISTKHSAVNTLLGWFNLGVRCRRRGRAGIF